MAMGKYHQNPTIDMAMGMASYYPQMAHKSDGGLMYSHGARHAIDALKEHLYVGAKVKINAKDAFGDLGLRMCTVINMYPHTIQLRYKEGGRFHTMTPSYVQLYFLINGEPDKNAGGRLNEDGRRESRG